MNEIFLFAMTRTGSTLLQRAFNQCYNVTVYGEHGGMLSDFARAYYGADLPCLAMSEYEPYRLHDPNIFAPCLSCVTLASFKGNMTDFIKRTLNPAAELRWGFKEVRYGKEPNCRVFDMLIDLFPEAQFVFLIRDPREQIQSIRSAGWTTESFDESVTNWQNQCKYFTQCYLRFPSQCRLIDYQSLRDVRGLFEWLDLNLTSLESCNLFKALPRTGETKNKQELLMGERMRIENECMPLYEAAPLL